MVGDPGGGCGGEAGHLEACSECGSRFKTISDDARSIASLLAVPAANLDVARAFDRVARAPKAQPALGFRIPILSPAPRPVKLAFAAALAAVALVVVAFASNGLFFQPRTLQTVPVTVPHVQALAQLAHYRTVTWPN